MPGSGVFRSKGGENQTWNGPNMEWTTNSNVSQGARVQCEIEDPARDARATREDAHACRGRHEPTEPPECRARGGRESAGTPGAGGAKCIARLGSSKGLDLAFLVNREHHRPCRRVDLRSDDVAQLAPKTGSRGLEARTVYVSASALFLCSPALPEYRKRIIGFART
jgi:hypothetical protein